MTAWWSVEGDPHGDGWVVTNGRKQIRFAPSKDLEARNHCDRLNQVIEGGVA